MAVPLYVFLGFLEAGKTSFIQETLEDPDFNTGEKTLLVLCEDGETEYEPEKFAGRQCGRAARRGSAGPDAGSILKNTRKSTAWTGCWWSTTVCGPCRRCMTRCPKGGRYSR